jgi:hypothetical protein
MVVRRSYVGIRSLIQFQEANAMWLDRNEVDRVVQTQFACGVAECNANLRGLDCSAEPHLRSPTFRSDSFDLTSYTYSEPNRPDGLLSRTYL